MAIKVVTYDFPVSCQLVKKLLIQVSAWWVVDVEKNTGRLILYPWLQQQCDLQW